MKDIGSTLIAYFFVMFLFIIAVGNIEKKTTKQNNGATR